jgi:ArsR family transcriptional regulator
MTDPVDEAAQLHKILGNPVRMRISRILAEDGAMHVGAICERLGMAQPSISHHLALLKVAGVVDTRREGKRVYYSLHPDTRGRLAATLLYAFGLEGTKIPKAGR